MGDRERFKHRDESRDFLLISELEILGLPKTVNSIGRKHWTIKQQEKKRWHMHVVTHCVLNKINDLNLKEARLELTRYSTTQPDFDNLASSFKYVIDGLVRAKVILDDKPSVIESPFFHWKKTGLKKGKITIRIFALEADCPRPA